jgi:hypothetical protein
MLCIS